MIQIEFDDISIVDEKMEPGTWYTLIDLCHIVFGPNFTGDSTQRGRLTRKLTRLRKRGYIERDFSNIKCPTYRLKPI